MYWISAPVGSVRIGPFLTDAKTMTTQTEIPCY
ncbi:hypothetical protein SAMN05519103_04860 [Rhizobiales bacterium GAS113]|nr:hypothetical protein SAMN05519103_04860 [Rhizobiales bacterium GAS113]SEE17251.1 hypothetical protein SAMN05519104_5395 [Rhizobiales bacterium GAS188]